MDRLLNENRRRPQDPGGGAEAVPPAPAPPADRRDRRRPDGVPCSLAAQVRRGGRCRASAAAQLLPGQLRRPFGARVRWAESPSQRAGGYASPASDWRAIEESRFARGAVRTSWSSDLRSRCGSRDRGAPRSGLAALDCWWQERTGRFGGWWGAVARWGACTSSTRGLSLQRQLRAQGRSRPGARRRR
jgi:hypothetical protein